LPLMGRFWLKLKLLHQA